MNQIQFHTVKPIGSQFYGDEIHHCLVLLQPIAVLGVVSSQIIDKS